MKLDIVNKNRVHDGFLKVDIVDIRLPNGQIISRDVIKKKNAVSIVAFTDDHEIYLTKQPRIGRDELEAIEIPAGLVDESETPVEAARRELMEETGCVVKKDLIPLGRYFADPACSTGVTYMFLALGVEKTQDLQLDDDECLESFKATIGEVLKMIDDEVIIDANSLITIDRALAYIDKYISGM